MTSMTEPTRQAPAETFEDRIAVELMRGYLHMLDGAPVTEADARDFLGRLRQPDDRPVDWDQVQLTVKVGAGVPDGVIRDDAGRPIGVGVAGYPHPVGKAACEACGKLLLFNLAVGIILHDDPAGDAACWAPQTTNAAPAQVTRGITIEDLDGFRQQLADAAKADPERFRRLRTGTWPPEEPA